MANYCTAQQAADICKKQATDIKQEWLDYVDELIDDYLGGGYKGAERTVQLYGDNGQLIRLPSDCATLTSITEEGSVLDASTYSLWQGTRLVRKTGMTGYFNRSLFGITRPVWYEDTEYVFTYTEPTVVPMRVQMVAAQMAAEILMFQIKYGLHGIANSASTNGSQGGGSLSVTTSWPASLQAELKNIISLGLRKHGI